MKEMDRKMLGFKSHDICELVPYVPGIRILKIGCTPLEWHLREEHG